MGPAIRSRVANREMPPWPIDKTVGIQGFVNDHSLSDTEVETIVRWVDNKAPEGNPPTCRRRASAAIT